MIDVVFLLLIFFLVASKMKETEGAIPAYLADQGVISVGEPRPDDPVVIYLEPWSGPSTDRNVAVKVGNRLGQDVGGRTDAHAFRVLQAQLRSLNEAVPETSVTIHAHQPVQFRHVVGALDAARQAGIEEVNFRAPAVAGAGGSDYYHR
jgi:biopolymer transport protein ExbD